MKFGKGIKLFLRIKDVEKFEFYIVLGMINNGYNIVFYFYSGCC